MKMVNLTIVIPTHERRDDLINLIDNIYALEKNISIDIIVVVDESHTDTIKYLHSNYPAVHTIKGDGEWWYTKSINEGLKYALNLRGKFILTLNDDVLLAKDFFNKLETVHLNDNIVMGSFAMTDDHPPKVVTSGRLIKNGCLGNSENIIPVFSRINLNEITGSYKSHLLPGRGMVIPKKIIKEIGLFDERFKQYHSDGDFTLRAIENGFEVNINWDLKIIVPPQKTNLTTSYLNRSYFALIKSFFNPVSRNYIPSKILFFRKHGPKLCIPIKLFIFIIVSFINVIRKKNPNGKEKE